MPFWLRLILLASALIAVLLATFGAGWRTWVEVFLILAPTSAALIKRTPALYLYFRRLRFSILNEETTWETGMRFKGHFTTDALASFVRQLSRDSGTATTVLEQGDARFLLRYDRVFTVEFLLTDELKSVSASGIAFGSLTVTMFDQVVSYRRATRMLEQTLMPLIERVRSAFKPDDANYSLRVRFDGHNPFFGMYVQQMKADLIDDFRLEFHLPSAIPKEHVRVGRNDIVIFALSPDHFRSAALTGLTFKGVTS